MQQSWEWIDVLALGSQLSTSAMPPPRWVLRVVAALALWLGFWCLRRGQRGFPPGPRGLPLVGNLLQLDLKAMPASLAKLSETHGPIFSVSLGQTQVVILAGNDIIKEALVTQAEMFIDRPEIPIFKKSLGNYEGLLLSHGWQWRARRRFTHMMLRNLGMGTKSIEEKIAEEAEFLVRALENKEEKPFDAHSEITNSAANVICSIIFGDRYDWNNKTFVKLMNIINENVELSGNDWSQIFNSFPLLKYFPGPHQRINENKVVLNAFIQARIEEHDGARIQGDPRDYLDAFIDKRIEDSLNPDTAFSDIALINTMANLFVAGSETTSATLKWGILLMLTHPKVQEQVQEEIDRVVGSNRRPACADRASMPYTNATVHEIQRYANILPMAFPHATTSDTKLRGYFLPKGTQVVALIHSALREKSLWETPEQFNPGHFLDIDGNFYNRNDFMAFSAGPRLCLGKNLARMEVFLFLTALLQRFSFQGQSGHPMPDLTPKSGIVWNPHRYEVCAIKR
ncbi:cytochrome P450 2F5-like [Lampetra fluviatilis]